MTPQQLVGIAIRIFSIVMIFLALPYLSGIPSILTSSGREDAVTFSVSLGFVYLVIGLIAWLFPMVISHKLVPKTSFENRFDTRPDEVATVGVALLGLWKILDVVPELVSYLFRAHLNAGSQSTIALLGTSAQVTLVFILIEAVIAFIFLFKAHKIALFITKPYS